VAALIGVGTQASTSLTGIFIGTLSSSTTTNLLSVTGTQSSATNLPLWGRYSAGDEQRRYDEARLALEKSLATFQREVETEKERHRRRMVFAAMEQAKTERKPRPRVKPAKPKASPSVLAWASTLKSFKR
jgi:hypothetical protein